MFNNRKRLAVLSATVLPGVFAGLSQAVVNNYYQGSGLLSGNVWGTKSGGPFGAAFASDDDGGIANFGVVGSVNVKSTDTNNMTVAGINATANFTINGSAPGGTIANFLDRVIPINVDSGVTLDFGLQPFTKSATAGYIKNGTGVLALKGAAYEGGFTLNAGTVIVRGQEAMGNGGSLTINGGTIAADKSRSYSDKYPGGITIGGDFQLGAVTGLASSFADITFNNALSLGAATRTITLGGSGIYTLGAGISGAPGVGLNFIGATSSSTVVLNGANVNTYTGPTSVTNTMLTLVFSGLAAPTNLIDPGSSLTLGRGAFLQVTQKSNTATSQTFNGTTLKTGVSTIGTSKVGSNSVTLALGNITREAGSILRLAPAAAGSITTGNTGSILGGYAVTGPAENTTWVTGGTITAFTAYNTNSLAADANADLRTATFSTDGVTLNSLRATTGNGSPPTAITVTNTGAMVIGSGGILHTSMSSTNAATTFNIAGNGTVTSGNGKDLIVWTMPSTTASKGNVVIDNTITDNGPASIGLTKAGAGDLKLTGVNTFTGDTVITEGTVTLGAAAGGNSLALQNSVLNYDFPAGTLVMTGMIGATLGGLKGTQNLVFPGTFELTLGNSNSPVNNPAYSGVISGTGAMLVKTGTNTQTLSGANTYSGSTTIAAGTLALAEGGSITNSDSIILNGGALDTSALGTFAVGAGQTLKGQGVFSASNVTTISGTLSIGPTHAAEGTASTITLTSGNVTLLGNEEFDLFSAIANSLGSADKFDAGAGNLGYGGTMKVSNPTGMPLSAGQSWDLFDFGTHSVDSFASAADFGVLGGGGNLPSLDANLKWAFNYGTGVLSIQSVPEPASVGLLAIGSMTLLRQRRRRKN